MPLMSEADNIKFSSHKVIKGVGYRKYDNFDAIEVPNVDAIPSDYPNMMGVPITFLSKYNPDQFEIVGNLGSYAPDGYSLASAIYVNGVKIYKRIAIRHKGGSK